MDIEAQVEAVLLKVLGDSGDIRSAVKSENDEWDSLASISILFELEETFNVEFNDEQIAEMISFDSICNAVKELIK